MFGRPRCREWTPLATQQLRLRSLIQIVGYNIRPPEGCRSQCNFYYTLHHTTMSAPFYTSERISSTHPKWKEIDSEITQSMSSSNVVIRIWCHMLNATHNSDQPIPDTIIQTWGVYFSGLRFIGANISFNFTSECFKSNALILQMHGGYFCSYKSLKLEVMPPENEEQSSYSSSSSASTRIVEKVTKPKGVCRKKYKKVDKEYSKSNSPVDRGFKHSLPSLRTSVSFNVNHRGDEDEKKSTEVKDNSIYEHLPNNFETFSICDKNCDTPLSSKIDLSETAEDYDLRNETEGTPKYRYLALNFLKSEIRPSYNATKLQKLHLLQYSIKKRQEAVIETKSRILQKSAPNNDVLSLDNNKRRTLKSLFSDDMECVKNGKIKVEERPVVYNGPRLALKLNDLLSFKTKPSPLQRAEHLRLTKQLEILRFKKIILSDERDAKLANIRRLKEIHAKLSEENQDVELILGSELMQGFHALSKRTEALKETKQSAAALRELATRSHSALANRRTELLADLQSIFRIEQKDQSVWALCDIPLPVCGDESVRRSNSLNESVASGFAAQLVTLIAAILNQPLRYVITLNGSASKILDLSNDLPDPNVPLYARGGDLNLYRYAMFLLNKCIVQLMWARGVHVTDLRPTLSNLKRLMTSPGHSSDTSKLFGAYKLLSEMECRAHSLRSLVASERGKYRPFNRFKDAVDGQSPQLVMSLQKHRHSRSVGSYHDDHELASLQASTTSIMGSEPSISEIEPKLTIVKHSSESEISKISLEADLYYGHNRLVRLSSNNGDVPLGGVEETCKNISDFCSRTDEDVEVNMENSNS